MIRVGSHMKSLVQTVVLMVGMPGYFIGIFLDIIHIIHNSLLKFLNIIQSLKTKWIWILIPLFIVYCSNHQIIWIFVETLNRTGEDEPKPGQLQSGHHVICGADVLAIYPSMDAETTAETVRWETIRSKVRLEGVNWIEATRHIAINFTKFETKSMIFCQAEGIQRIPGWGWGGRI